MATQTKTLQGLDKTPIALDVAQAKRHLKLLGYTKNEPIFLNTLLAKDPERRVWQPQGITDHGKKQRATAGQLPKTQPTDSGLYFVVNGQGWAVKNIRSCRALFCEWDDIPKEEQVRKWQELGLPEPSLMVDTRNSIHIYWVLDKPVGCDDWRSLMSDLLVFAGADRSLKNPNRLMRLAGSWHAQIGEEPYQCQIIHESENRYSFEQMRAIVPVAPTSKAQDQPAPRPVATFTGEPLNDLLHKQIYPRLSPLTAYNWSGHQWQQASSTKYRGSCPWHDSKSGTAFYIDYSDGQWLWRCPACDVGGDILQYRHKLIHGVNSVPKGNDFVEGVRSLAKDAGVDLPEFKSANGNGHHPRGSSAAQPNKPDARDVLAPDDLESAYRAILDANLRPAQKMAERIKLRRRSAMSEREFDRFCDQIEADWENAASLDEQRQRLNRLLEASQSSLSLDGVLPGRLPQLIQRHAHLMGVNSEAYLSTLLPAIASLAHADTRLSIFPATGLEVRPICFTVLVAPSGSAKSPIQRLMLWALQELDKADRQDYDEEYKEYEENLRAWNAMTPKDRRDVEEPQPPQRPRNYYTSDFTLEAIARISKDQQGRGLLVWGDELAGTFKSANQYKNGKGNDNERLLQLRDGHYLKVSRASGHDIACSTSVSLTGTIQPQILQQIMGDDDASGKWARFWFTKLPSSQPRSIPTDDDARCYTEIQDTLARIYRSLANSPATRYQFTPEAQRLYCRIFEEYDTQRRTATHPAMQAVFSKAQAHVGEVALLLHLLHNAHDGRASVEVSTETLGAAYQILRYYHHQLEELQGWRDSAAGEIEPLMARIIELSRDKGAIAAKDVRNYLWEFRRGPRQESPDAIRGRFAQLVEMGYGSVEGKGNRLKFIADPVEKTVEESSTSRGTVEEFSTAETLTSKGIESNSRGIEDFSPLSSRENPPPENPENRNSDTYLGNSSIPLPNGRNIDRELDTAVEEFSTVSSTVSKSSTVSPENAGRSAVESAVEVSTVSSTVSSTESSTEFSTEADQFNIESVHLDVMSIQDMRDCLKLGLSMALIEHAIATCPDPARKLALQGWLEEVRRDG